MPEMNIPLVLGVLYIGIVINTYLYGIVTSQFTAYWKSSSGDRFFVKFMLVILFALDSLHSVAVLYLGWVYCVKGFTDTAVLELAIWPYALTPSATVTVAIVIQAFLGHRVYCLLKSKIIYGFILLASLAAFVLGMYCSVRIWVLFEFRKLAVLNKPLTAWLSIQAGVDLIISGLLIYCLSRMKSKGFRRMDRVVNRMIRNSIQSGLFAAIFALLDMTTFVKLGHTGLCGMFAFPIGRLYTITLLDTLLARKAFQTELMSPAFLSIKPSDILPTKGTASTGTTANGSSTGTADSDIIFSKDTTAAGSEYDAKFKADAF